MKRCVIFGGADIESYDFLDLRDEDYIICADSGYRHALKLSKEPDVVLGDMDSFNGKPDQHIEFYKFNSEKDETDLEIALSLASERGFNKILITGALGGRFDHTIGNICLLKKCADMKLDAVIKDSRTEVRLLNKSFEFNSEKNVYYSVFPFFEEAVISLIGFKYKLSGKLLKPGDVLGISNEAVRDKCTVSLERGSVLFVKSLKD